MSRVLKTIGIVELGGTINSISEQPFSEFYKGPSISISSLIKEFRLEDSVEIHVHSLTQKISHELTITDLIKLANVIQDLLDNCNYDGVVVTLGTNALKDVSYFIGLTVKTEKPIVFTGAHYPQNSLAFDGVRNLFNAINIASSAHATKMGVLITFNDYVVTARDAVKNNPGLNSSFATEGNGVIGHVVGGQFIPKSKSLYRSEFFISEQQTLPKVTIIYAHLDMDDSLIKASIASGVSGIISAGFGNGYQAKNITLALQEAVRIGIIVVRCARAGCAHTSVDETYDKKYGFVVSKGLSPHKSSILLSLALTLTRDLNKIQQIFDEY